MSNTFRSTATDQNVTISFPATAQVGALLPTHCAICAAWQQLALEQVMSVCAQNSAISHMEVDAELVIGLHDALRKWGGSVSGYSSARSIDEFSKWRGPSQIHLVKHFAQIIFTGSLPSERDRELYNSVPALIILDCDHVPFRSIVEGLPEDMLVGFVSQRFTTSMMRVFEDQVSVLSRRAIIDSNAKRLTQRLIQAK